MANIKHALNYAHEKHKKQKRKDNKTPYFVHLLDVASLLRLDSKDQDLICAAFLHDIIEDNKFTKVTEKALRKEFGDKITDLVMAVTEKNKELPWKDRKEIKLKELVYATKEVKLLKCADALSNITAKIRDYHLVGEDIWKRFNAGKAEQEYYYRGILNCSSAIKNSNVYKLLKKSVEELFGNKIKQDGKKDLNYEILLFLKTNYGEWYSIDELSVNLDVKREIINMTMNKLRRKCGHIWYRTHDWRGRKEVRKDMYKYRDRTTDEQDSINEKILDAFITEDQNNVEEV